MSSVVPSRLKVWDYVTFVALIIMASCIGIYHAFKARKSKNTQDFLVRSHDLGVAPLILSTAATFMSAIGILGLPTESYVNGMVFLTNSLSNTLLLPLGVFLYLPIFFNLEVNSIYEYLELRFNRFMRLCASTLMNIQMVLYTSCVMYAPALALNQVTGLHLWASVASIGIICIIYTSMGGIKAVVWADVTQVTVMFIVTLIILIKGIVNVGGFASIWQILEDGKRTEFIVTSSEYSQYSIWTMIIGSTVHALGMVATNQMFMQRFLCNRTLKNAQRSFLGSGLMISILVGLNAVGGIIMYARYHDCDPLLNGQVTSRDQIMALFAMEILSFCDGLPGIFVAAMLCATLSTLSSSLNSLATITMEDYIKPIKKDLSPAREMLIAKLTATLYGGLCIVLVLFAERIDGLVKTVFAVNGITSGPVLAVFSMGILFPWINYKGAIAGFFSSILTIAGIFIGSMTVNVQLPSAPISTSGCNITENLSDAFNSSALMQNSSVNVLMTASNASKDDVLSIYKLSTLWYPSWSCLIGFTVAIIVSIFTGIQNPEEVDPKLVSPLVIKLIRRLPESWQQKLGFNKTKGQYLHLTMTDKSTKGLVEGSSVLKYSETTTQIDHGNTVTEDDEGLTMTIKDATVVQ